MNRTNVKMSAFWVPTDCEILQAKLHFVSTSFALFMHISSWHFNHMHEHNINVNIPYVYYSIRHRIFICVRHISLSAHFSASFQNFSYILIALKKNISHFFVKEAMQIFAIGLLRTPSIPSWTSSIYYCQWIKRDSERCARREGGRQWKKQ